MTKKNIGILFIIGSLSGIIAVYFFIQAKNIPSAFFIQQTPGTPKTKINSNTNTITNQGLAAAINIQAETKSALPMVDFYSRITKKPFGIYITPKTSPIQPERFTGYHTGADAETTTQEKDTDIPVYSIANGTVAYKGYVSGYGGVLIAYYTVDGEKLTALYGHLRLASVELKKNDAISIGQKIGVLGTGFSTETNGERKHLHLSFLPGHQINYKGYVSEKSGLTSWIDPVGWLQETGAKTPK